MQEVFSVSNEVAAELATIGDGVLEALRDRLECTILLRGNRVTIEGDDAHVAEARAVLDAPWRRLRPVKAFPGIALSVNTAKSSSASLTVPCKESSSKAKASGSSSLAWI